MLAYQLENLLEPGSRLTFNNVKELLVYPSPYFIAFEIDFNLLDAVIFKTKARVRNFITAVTSWEKESILADLGLILNERYPHLRLTALVNDLLDKQDSTPSIDMCVIVKYYDKLKNLKSPENATSKYHVIKNLPLHLASAVYNKRSQQVFMKQSSFTLPEVQLPGVLGTFKGRNFYVMDFSDIPLLVSRSSSENIIVKLKNAYPVIVTLNPISLGFVKDLEFPYFVETAEELLSLKVAPFPFNVYNDSLRVCLGNVYPEGTSDYLVIYNTLLASKWNLDLTPSGLKSKIKDAIGQGLTEMIIDISEYPFNWDTLESYLNEQRDSDVV